MNNVYVQGREASEVAQFMTRVYGWMSLALAVTGFVAFYTASSEAILSIIFGSQLAFWGLVMLYSVMNGLLFSSIFIVYTGASIALTFFITAGTFAAMSVYGYTTKADLSKIGSIAMMALIGILIASLVNFFLESETLYWIISYVGVAVFVALVAYDTQKIKDIAIHGFDGEASAKKMSILGALTLYLDFINLFLFLLRLFGSRRS